MLPWLDEKDFAMHGSAITIGPAGVALALFAPLRRAVRPSLPPGKSVVKRAVAGAVPARRKVPISAWQTHSWTKKIVQGRIEPAMPARARRLRAST